MPPHFQGKRSATRQIDLVLLPRFSMMAYASAVEPLRAANQLGGGELYSWRTFSIDGGVVVASNGAHLVPDGDLADAGRGDTLIVCAGVGAEHFNDKALTRRLRELARTRVVLSGVCTGTIALARAGLLDGYRCTLHWENVEGFAEEFPHLDITATLFEIDRDRHTSSGGTAPMDMMISRIAREHGDDLGVKVAEFLLHHAVRHPTESQRLPIQYRTGISHPKLLAAIAHMEAYIESPVPLGEVAEQVGLSPRQLERLFKTRLGKKPSRYYLELRLQRARLLLQQTSMSVIQVAVASGFNSASHFARCYGEFFGQSPRAQRSDLQRVPRLREAPAEPEPMSVFVKPKSS
jgi:transcriptional regulator GlxA family with amidase domain